MKNYTSFSTRLNEIKYYVLSTIENIDVNQKIKTLKMLCATRWVQRYDAVHDFIELFKCVVEALEFMLDWKDSSAIDASLLLKSMDYEFLISINIVQVKTIFLI